MRETDDEYDPVGMFERPLPRKSNGDVEIFECLLTHGPLKGKRLGDMTKSDCIQFQNWHRFQQRVIEKAEAEFAAGAETVRVPADFLPER